MSVRNLDKLFKPSRVAVFGACNDSEKLGFLVLRNMLEAGFSGVLYPVNPTCEAVQGIYSYPDLTAVPKPPDLAVICTPPEQVPELLRACGENNVPAVLILSRGFRDKSAENTRLEQEVAHIAKQYVPMRVLGPNSLGIISPKLGLNASFAVSMPRAGHLALISQSAALSNAILDRAAEKGIGLSHFVSLGNLMDVSFGDLIDYFNLDGNTRAIILYLQSVDNPRNFMSAARACARLKPLVAYKAGRFAESAQAAASHTGAMVAEDHVYEAAFQRAGIVRALELDDVFDVAELLACQRLPEGERLAIISNSGGAAVVAADALIAHRGRLATFSHDTLERLQQELPACNLSGNPVDLGDSAPPEHFAAALQAVAADPGTDGILVLFTPQMEGRSNRTARAVGDTSKNIRKPILAAWVGGDRVRKGIRLLNAADLPTHATPEHAVRAFMHLISYARNLEILYETPRDIPLSFSLNRRKLHKHFTQIFQRESGEAMLSAYQSHALLEAYDIPFCETRFASSTEMAVEAALSITTSAVAMKAVTTPELVHKTDAGGVALNLRTPEQIRHTYHTMAQSIAERRPDVEFKGVQIQPMERIRDGVELILGAKKDPTFGSVILVGMGGITTDIYQDRAVGLPPLNERLARRMLESLQAWPLLNGYRGNPAVDLDLLIEIMMRFSYLVADYPEFREIDINPLLVTPTKAVALDAVMILDSEGEVSEKRYQHLAIRPYPEEYVRCAELKDDTAVTLRPIRPEDEPLWQALLTSASPESIRFRFRSMFKHVSHEMATRHCYIDYEREISIVGEIEEQGERRLIGVGGLSLEADETTAEFAVLVTDAWQGRGLGGLLLDYCMEIAGHWGVVRIVAETDPRNRKMLESFDKRGFKAKRDFEEEVVYLHKDLE